MTDKPALTIAVKSAQRSTSEDLQRKAQPLWVTPKYLYNKM